jgi:hypothetical protein
MTAPDSGSIIIAWWGALLSTSLALIKLWEVWRDRFQIEVTYCLRGEPSLGNDILIRNLTNRPLILAHWELFYRIGKWPRNEYESLHMADMDDGDQRIDAYSTLKLHFANENYFSWNNKALDGRSIYIHLHVAGRKPIIKKVYPD